MPLTDRQLHLFNRLVRQYTDNGEAVGSETLAADFGLSSATVRNELVALEAAGLIAQPHTSAGRIPTEKGYRFFIQKNLRDAKNASREKPQPYEALVGRGLVPRRATPEEAIKVLARSLAEEMEEVVVVGFGPRHVYYTGLPYVFAQPEFEELARVVMFSELMDRLDDVMAAVFPRVGSRVQVWVGRENPFGSQCGAIIAPFRTRTKHGVLGLLGPVRMDYERGVSLLEHVREALSKV